MDTGQKIFIPQAEMKKYKELSAERALGRGLKVSEWK